jgi:hypothetical protein
MKESSMTDPGLYALLSMASGKKNERKSLHGCTSREKKTFSEQQHKVQRGNQPYETQSLWIYARAMVQPFEGFLHNLSLCLFS